MSIKAVEAAPEFPSPKIGFDNYPIYRLDLEQDDRMTVDLGPVTSVYGEEDEVYLRLYWFDLWDDKLIYASKVPITADSKQEKVFSANPNPIDFDDNLEHIEEI